MNSTLRGFLFLFGTILFVGVVYAVSMSGSYSIDVEQDTYDLIQNRAQQLGITVDELISIKLDEKVYEFSADRSQGFFQEQISILMDSKNITKINLATDCLENINEG